jgi:hypothetical protein
MKPLYLKKIIAPVSDKICHQMIGESNTNKGHQLFSNRQHDELASQRDLTFIAASPSGRPSSPPIFRTGGNRCADITDSIKTNPRVGERKRDE